MNRPGIAALSLLLAASAASANQFKDDCKQLKKGAERLNEAANIAFPGGLVRVGGPNPRVNRSVNRSYLDTVDALGKSDLKLMAGFKEVLEDVERVDPHTGEKVDCDKVQSALDPLMTEYKKVLDKFAAAGKPCTTGDFESVKKGECGKAIKAAFDLRDAFWKTPVKAYARAESTSNQQCQARFHGYGGFYSLQNEPTTRKVKSDKKLSEVLGLKEQADAIKKAWDENLAKVKGPQLKPAVAGSFTVLNSARQGYKAFAAAPATSNRKIFEAGINLVVSSLRISKLHVNVCLNGLAVGETCERKLYERVADSGLGQYRCVLECSGGNVPGPVTDFPVPGARACVAPGTGAGAGGGPGDEPPPDTNTQYDQ